MEVKVVEIDLTVKVDGLRAAATDGTHVALVEEATDNYSGKRRLVLCPPYGSSSAGTYRALKQNKVLPLPPFHGPRTADSPSFSPFSGLLGGSKGLSFDTLAQERHSCKDVSPHFIQSLTR